MMIQPPDKRRRPKKRLQRQDGGRGNGWRGRTSREGWSLRYGMSRVALGNNGHEVGYKLWLCVGYGRPHMREPEGDCTNKLAQ